jgi:hypothetical protein
MLAVRWFVLENRDYTEMPLGLNDPQGLALKRSTGRQEAASANPQQKRHKNGCSAEAKRHLRRHSLNFNPLAAGSSKAVSCHSVVTDPASRGATQELRNNGCLTTKDADTCSSRLRLVICLSA